ncbi:MAG: 16S rRNA (adenine(1518)-N(6)/adenine(1519)-N(6))-dimethyltransferase RsmA [bacterium]|nr:16S rRNA (adenine(1518)-N(6)/adenine(1519)-N(6))-dimethyltransferase RsmA [bacterium]MCX7916615.1 16S rRNA (adenine(1518)-N(6)/adenine(1519)-N(6))-dimethyltransferase RsmA [bacterium]MDW8164113.1 16S rRNA (adenine(1518)-N(6)/adenine(1519)-N(6))-dimethyltransferase RsmA [Candidatus Omnitrophota bacterium]
MKFLTLKEIRKLKEIGNINIKKHLGQHFLIDKNARDKLLSFANLNKKDIVIEIGPGLGSLTEGIIEKVKEYYGFEIDEDFCKILEKNFSCYKKFHLIKKDFLNSDESFWNSFESRVKVIGNTPYYLSTPILFHILKFHKRIKLALLTVQKEVGERFVGIPGTKQYCPISVLLYIYTDTKICYSLNKNVFYPRPKVESVVVKIIPLKNPKIKIENKEKFFEFLPLIFSYRRKKLTNVVKKIFRIEKEIMEKNLLKYDISPSKRVEELTPEQIYLIFKIIQNFIIYQDKKDFDLKV